MAEYGQWQTSVHFHYQVILINFKQLRKEANLIFLRQFLQGMEQKYVKQKFVEKYGQNVQQLITV